ncbi:MAG: hypothetical protein HY682_01455, partial [Chloroflexi bacterium]|nr:hypothetical protein [Chloroflexota bacterium]
MAKAWFSRSRWTVLLALVGGLVAAIAVACGGEEAPTPTTAPAQPTATKAAATAAPAATPTTAATATAAPQQATATPAPTKPAGPSGDIVRAIQRVESIYGVAYQGPYRGSAHQQTGGVEERLFWYDNATGDSMSPWLGTAWSVDPAGTKVTFKVRTDVPWNAPKGFEAIDFGKFNAQDVVDWLNTGNATTNPESTYPDGGDFAAVFLEAKKVSDDTLEVGLVSPTYFCMPVSQMGCLGAERGPYLTRTIKLMGLDWAQANIVATGPFVQGLCIPGNRCTVHALDKHWRKVPALASVTVIQVPEPQTRLAMLKSGQADLADVDFKLVPAIVKDQNDGLRYLETMPGGFVGQSVIY